MATNYIQDGSTLVASNTTSQGHVATDIASGEVIDMDGQGVCIALGNIAAEADGVVGVEGVYEVAKITTAGFHFGQRVFFDSREKKLTNVATNNTFAGVIWEEAAETATTAKIKINGFPQYIQAENVELFDSVASLTALVQEPVTIADSNFTALDAADPTKAEIDEGIDALKDAVVTALNAKADNADVEILRGEIETRLDNLETKVNLIITNLIAAKLMEKPEEPQQ